jgi:hypothetical protein
MNFRISAAYQWRKQGEKKADSHSEMAIKEIVKQVNNVLKSKPSKNGLEYKTDYNRLRASAGKNMLDSILRKMSMSNAIIFDITETNPNVFIELGIAILTVKSNPDLLLYLIKENKDDKSLFESLPSDLQGYFITEYTVEKGKVTFKDNGSLRMSLSTEVKSFYNNQYEAGYTIDEVDVNEEEV